MRRLADAIESHDRAEAAKGDGKAVFMPDMTEEEYAVHLLEEDHGWREFRDKIFGRTPEQDTTDV